MGAGTHAAPPRFGTRLHAYSGLRRLADWSLRAEGGVRGGLPRGRSALDMENEAHLYGQMRAAGITFISVGHRPSLVQVPYPTFRAARLVSFSFPSRLELVNY